MLKGDTIFRNGTKSCKHYFLEQTLPGVYWDMTKRQNGMKNKTRYRNSHAHMKCSCHTHSTTRTAYCCLA